MPERNYANRTLFHGDNLDFLRGMNSGTVNLIATDPPFNKSRDFHATPNSLASGARFVDRWRWKDDVQGEWVDAIKDDWAGVWQAIENGRANHSESMAAFLCWLGIRLIEMHRILADDGSLYLHIDHTAHAYAKCLMDAIFGRRYFRDAIVWNRSAENLSRKKYRRAAETLLYYTKTNAFVWNQQFESLNEAQQSRDYRFSDERGPYTTTSCTNNAPRPNMVYEFHGNVRQWRYSRETMLKYEKLGLLVFNDDGIPRRKRYLDESPGRAATNVWSDISVLSSNDNERTGYPTQKPLALYERIIKASSNPGALVLDPFCGCATTPVAAEKLGRQWVGMDIWDGAHTIVIDRLQKEIDLQNTPPPPPQESQQTIPATL